MDKKGDRLEGPEDSCMAERSGNYSSCVFALLFCGDLCMAIAIAHWHFYMGVVLGFPVLLWRFVLFLEGRMAKWISRVIVQKVVETRVRVRSWDVPRVLYSHYSFVVCSVWRLPLRTRVSTWE